MKKISKKLLRSNYQLSNMKLELDIPENLAKKMESYEDVDWEDMLLKSIEGFIEDFTILEKLKEFWGTTRHPYEDKE